MGGEAYVRPVERLTPARKAETGGGLAGGSIAGWR